MSRSAKKTIALAVVVSALLFGSYGAARAFQPLVANAPEWVQIFTDVLTIVHTKYVEEVSIRDLVYNSLDGMLTHLDPHSAFMKPEEMQEMSIDTRGKFEGLGIEITLHDHYIMIISPIDGSPAAEAGLISHDYIVKIETESTRDMSLIDAVKRLRGPAGSKVKLEIFRKGWAEPKPYVLTRAGITVQTVRGKTLEKGYGYVKLSQFNQNSTDALRDAMKKLEKDGALKGVVLDLRNDPGGLLDQAISVADMFVDDGLIVYTRGRGNSQEFSAAATHTAAYKNLPMVVLINAGSASASEIVAGCLQDHHRAILVGERSFGKGSVQTVVPLPDGSGLRLTTAKYYTPAGRDIQAHGIDPDVVVPGEPWAGMDDNRKSLLREADLERHLQGAPEKAAPPAAGADEPIVPEDRDNNKEKKGPAQADSDPQLEMALQMLKAWPAFEKAAAPGK